MHLDGVQQVGNAAGRHHLGNGIFRNSASANSARSPNQDALNGIPDSFASNAARPTICWSVEALAFPPVGIPTSGVHRHFHAARPGFTQLVAREVAALTIRRAGVMKPFLFWVRLVVGEPVLGLAPGLLGAQH